MANEESSNQDSEAQQASFAKPEEIKQVVLQVLESQQGQEPNGDKSSARLARVFRWILSQGVTIPLLLSALLTLAGLIWFSIPPWRILQGAVHSYREAELKDDIVEHHLELGDSFLNVGRPEAAKAEYDEALKLDPTNALVQLSFRKTELLAQILERNFDPATVYEQILQLKNVGSADLPNAFNDKHLSHMLSFEGDIFLDYDEEEAERLYEEAASTNPQNPYPVAAVADLYMRQHKIDEALIRYKKAHQTATWHPQYQSNLAYALYENKQYEEAAEQYEDLLDWDPGLLQGYFELPKVYLVLGNLEDAYLIQRDLVESLVDDEKLTSLEKNKGRLFYLTDSQSSSVHLPSNTEKKFYAYYSIALTSYLLGKEEEAEEYVSRARDVPISSYSKSEVIRLMQHDIRILQEEQEGLVDKTDEFKSEFL